VDAVQRVALVKLTVRYFASLREALGSTQVIEVSAQATVGQVRAALMATSTSHATALAPHRAVFSALNHVMCGNETLVGADDELAFFPPVTGG
jgi:sulfur-carrier protein